MTLIGGKVGVLKLCVVHPQTKRIVQTAVMKFCSQAVIAVKKLNIFN